LHTHTGVAHSIWVFSYDTHTQTSSLIVVMDPNYIFAITGSNAITRTYNSDILCETFCSVDH